MALEFLKALVSGQNAMRRTLALVLAGAILVAGVEAAEQAGAIAVRPDSPQNYTVQQGDTLWDIAGRFLEQPWLWPQVWQVNPQIQNPDLIYPGDTISLSYQNGQPVLSLNRNGDAPGVANAALPSLPPSAAGIRTERRSPEIRRETLLSPIPAIPLERVFAFLSKSSVVDASSFDNAPYLLGEREGRTLFSKGDEVFARGEWDPNLVTYDIVREGRQFKDPDTGEVLGVESIVIGSATIDSYNGDRAIMEINSILQEARVGDRLLPTQALDIDSSYMPKPPAFDVDAAIASIGDGRSLGGQYDTLVLNQGSGIGLQAGHLLVVQKPAVVVEDEVGKRSAFQSLRRAVGLGSGRRVEYPGENIATVLIYRVYEHASLGLVLSARQSISLDDRLVKP